MPILVLDRHAVDRLDVPWRIGILHRFGAALTFMVGAGAPSAYPFHDNVHVRFRACPFGDGARRDVRDRASSSAG